MAACLKHARTFAGHNHKHFLSILYQVQSKESQPTYRLFCSLSRHKVPGVQRYLSRTTEIPVRWNSSETAAKAASAIIDAAGDRVTPSDYIPPARPVPGKENVVQDIWNATGDSTETATRTASAVIDAAGDRMIPADYIPPAPPLPDNQDMVPEILNALGEPTLSSLGLGSWSPSGMMQQALEALHVSTGIPWWGCIVAGTICIRLMMFPLVIKSQRNVAHMHNHMPTLTRLQERFTQARQSGNAVEAARAGHELMDFMKRNEIKPFRNFLVPMAQIPVFLSVFIGLRQMANLPVESMKSGGLWWFYDLTLPDPFYALPLLTSATFLLTVELGVDGVKAGTMNHTMKWFMRAMPFIMLPLISNFPTAMLCYWFSSNIFSLIQVLFLKIPAVRSYFKIERMVHHDPSSMPKKKGFLEGFRESMSNAKLAQQMEERQRMDALRFKQAGEGPIQKTYPFDPSKTKISNSELDSSKPTVEIKPKS